MTKEHELLRDIHLSIYDYLNAVDKQKTPITLSKQHKKMRGLIGDAYKLYNEKYDYD